MPREHAMPCAQRCLAAECQVLDMLECVGAGVVAADLSGRVTYFNAKAFQLVGSDSLDMDPRRWPEAFGLYASDMTTPFRSEELPLVRAFRGEQTDDVRMFVRNAAVPEGRHLAVTGRPWRTPGGELLGGVVVFEDVGQRHEAEQEMREAHRFLESIVENVPTMIFVKDAHALRFERFNRAGEELLGIPRERLLGKNDYDFFPQEQADFFTSRDRETLAARQVINIPEEPIDTAQGRRWLHTKKVPILDEEGKPKYLLGISLDVTERKEAEQSLRHAHEQLEQRVQERTAELQRANEELRQEIAERQRVERGLRRSEEQLRQAQKMEAVGRLAGGVAHDFNNMLTAILGYGQLLVAQEPSQSNTRKGLEQIVTAAERAAGLTRQLLAFSRQQVLQPSLLDLNKVVRGMEDMLRRLIGEDVELLTEYAPEPCMVLADRSQMEQIVLNLIVNARDAMRSGGELSISLSNIAPNQAFAAAHLTLQPGKYVMLTVSDTGVGMPPEVVTRIFEPFFTTKPRGEGTGLGLSTVFGVVKQSGGDIFVDSEPGHGSTFRIYLPRAEGRIKETSERPAAGRAAPGCTVLLVEDEDLVGAAAQAILEADGYTVLRAREAGDAELVCGSHGGPIHLLLTDVVMPGMNGRQLATRIQGQRPSIRVLYMSGYADSAILQHGLLDSAVQFLAKPFTPETLTRKVREVLGTAQVVSASSQ